MCNFKLLFKTSSNWRIFSHFVFLYFLRKWISKVFPEKFSYWLLVPIEVKVRLFLILAALRNLDCYGKSKWAHCLLWERGLIWEGILNKMKQKAFRWCPGTKKRSVCIHRCWKSSFHRHREDPSMLHCAPCKWSPRVQVNSGGYRRRWISRGRDCWLSPEPVVTLSVPAHALLLHLHYLFLFTFCLPSPWKQGLCLSCATVSTEPWLYLSDTGH